MAFLGGTEMAIIGAAAVFLLWGPKKLPELARSMGTARQEFNKANNGEEDNR